MIVTFIVPPSFDDQQPAERSAGCTRIVYPMPNIYELQAVAVVENIEGIETRYCDFIAKKSPEVAFERFLHRDNSQVYIIWSVNLAKENDLQALQIIRKHQPEATMIWLGPGPTHFIADYLPSPKEIIIRGEVEETLRELIHAMYEEAEWRSIKGISYRSDDRVINNPTRPLMKSLDDLPIPARHWVARHKYRNPKLKATPYTTMVTSRNCPYKCIYCVPSSMTFAREIEHKREHGKKPPISYMSIKRISTELDRLWVEGYRAIGFMDDNFIWTEERTLAISQLLKEKGFKWGCQARVDAITEPIARALGESGCGYVDLGVESFDDEILKFIKKGITSAQIEQAIRLLKKYRVPVKLNILIGTSPLETRQSLKRTLRKAMALKVDQVMFNIVSPFPGTEFYEMAKENGWIAGGEYKPTDVQRESILSYPHLSSKEMERILFRHNLTYFISPLFVLKQIKRFSSVKEFTHALKALKIKLFGGSASNFF